MSWWQMGAWESNHPWGGAADSQTACRRGNRYWGANDHPPETSRWRADGPNWDSDDGSRTAHGTDAFNATKTKVQHKKDYWRYRDASDGTAGWQTDGSECDFKDGSWKAPEIDW